MGQPNRIDRSVSHSVLLTETPTSQSTQPAAQLKSTGMFQAEDSLSSSFPKKEKRSSFGRFKQLFIDIVSRPYSRNTSADNSPMPKEESQTESSFLSPTDLLKKEDSAEEEIESNEKIAKERQRIIAPFPYEDAAEVDSSIVEDIVPNVPKVVARALSLSGASELSDILPNLASDLKREVTQEIQQEMQAGAKQTRQAWRGYTYLASEKEPEDASSFLFDYTPEQKKAIQEEDDREIFGSIFPKPPMKPKIPKPKKSKTPKPEPKTQPIEERVEKKKPISEEKAKLLAQEKEAFFKIQKENFSRRLESRALFPSEKKSIEKQLKRAQQQKPQSSEMLEIFQKEMEACKVTRKAEKGAPIPPPPKPLPRYLRPKTKRRFEISITSSLLDGIDLTNPNQGWFSRLKAKFKK